MRKAMVSVVAAALALGGAVRAQTLRIEGSTTVGPIADAFAEYFKSLDPKLDITVKKTGSGDGAAALIDSRCDAATMSRFMKPEEFTKAVANNVQPVVYKFVTFYLSEKRQELIEAKDFVPLTNY